MSDDCVFVRRENGSDSFIIIYVDDLLIMSDSEDNVAKIKKELSSVFRMKVLGPAKHLLGIRVDRTSKGFCLDESVLTEQYSSKFGNYISHLCNLKRVLNFSRPPNSHSGLGHCSILLTEQDLT